MRSIRGNNVGAKIQSSMEQKSFDSRLNDLFLHALFARLAFKNNENYEFKTRYNPATNIIELDIPDKYLEVLDQITGIQRGPNFQKFVSWLIGSRQFSMQDGDISSKFLSIADFNIWFGASFLDTNQGALSIALPATLPSAVNTNFKTSSEYAGSISLRLNWMYREGTNTNLLVKCNVTVIDSSGDSQLFTNEVDISTFNLISGDIRVTTLIDMPVVGPDSLIDIILLRNYANSSDPRSETISIMGIEVVT